MELWPEVAYQLDGAIPLGIDYNQIPSGVVFYFQIMETMGGESVLSNWVKFVWP